MNTSKDEIKNLYSKLIQIEEREETVTDTLNNLKTPVQQYESNEYSEYMNKIVQHDMKEFNKALLDGTLDEFDQNSVKRFQEEAKKLSDISLYNYYKEALKRPKSQNVAENELLFLEKAQKFVDEYEGKK